MNYYDELLANIDKLININKYDDAKALILNELNMAYVPKDVLDKLNSYLDEIKDLTYVSKTISDDDIDSYLYMDENHQLIAVDELNKRNLRDYIDICAKYLKEGSYKNAKALLIDSLIRQEINHTFEFEDYSFNPIELKPIEMSDGFISASKLINDKYMKEPSLAKMAMDLLYKECLLYLPKQANTMEGEICANKIIKYINDAFSAK